MLMLLYCIAVLASDFKIVDGRVTVKVPNVEPGNDYCLVCKYHLCLVVNWPFLTYIAQCSGTQEISALNSPSSNERYFLNLRT